MTFNDMGMFIRMTSLPQRNNGPLYLLLLGILPFLSCSRNIVKFNPTPAEFSFVAIGDVGEGGDKLERNAEVIQKMYREDKFEALIFLGDNFYPIGLNLPRKNVPGKIASVLGPFGVLLDSLGRQNVHAIAGNHDYYNFLAIDKSFFFGLFKISTGPHGFTDRGNQRAREIMKWTYYSGMPQEAIYGLEGNKMQMIFFDSALPLRVDTPAWKPALDSLHQLLLARKNDAGIKWRLLFAHHPFYSLGPHGGYNFWDEEGDSLQYLDPCRLELNAVTYMVNQLDPEDLCGTKYQAYIDSVRSLIRRSEVSVQALVAGHEHSLQFLYYPDKDAACEACPKIHVISGAGSKADLVKAPAARRNEYTWPITKDKDDNRSISAYGFVRFDLQADTLRIRFYNGETGEVLRGDGREAFIVTQEGKLILK